MANDSHTATILAVDDNPSNLKILNYALSYGGYDIRVEAQGTNVLNLVQNNPPDLILLDVMLPDIDGFEICQRLKENSKTQDIPVIFMTARANTADKIEGFKVGAVDYITKPFETEEVLARVNIHLQLRQLNKTLESRNEELRKLTNDLEKRVFQRTVELSKSLQKQQTIQVQLQGANKMLDDYANTLEKKVEERTQQLQKEIQERTKAEAALQNIVAGTAAVTGENFFPALVEHLALALEVKHAIVSELKGEVLQTLGVWSSGKLQRNFRFQMDQNFYEQTLHHDLFYCDRNIQASFLQQLPFSSKSIQSYLGIALLDSAKQPIGVLYILHEQKLVDWQQFEGIFQIFAARAAAELERKKATEALQQVNQELEIRVEKRTAALRQSQEYLRQLTENIESVFWLTDPNKNQMIYISKAYEKIWGYSPQQLYDDPRQWLNPIHPEDRDRILAALPKQIHGQYNEEYRIIRADGEIRWIRDRAFPIRDQDGKVYRIAGFAEDITQDKQIAETVALQERAIAASNNGIIIVDARQEDYPTIFANPAFEKMTGYPVAEILGKNCRFLQGEDTHQTELQRLRQAIQNGESCTVTLRNYRQNGSFFWNQLSISPIYDSSGTLTHYIGIQSDVTERKAAEKEIEATNLRLVTVLESLQVGILLEDNTGNIAVVNQAFCDLFNRSLRPSDLIGMPYEDLIKQYKLLFLQSEEFVPRIQSITQAKGSIIGEVIQLVDGRVWERDYIPIWSGDSDQGHLWQYRDITLAQHDQQVLKYQLTAMEAAIDGIAILNTEDQYTYLNTAHTHLFGYDHPQEMLGKTWREIYPPEEVKRLETEVFPILGRDRHWQGEAIAHRKDGSTFTEEVSLTLIEGGGLVCVCRDITGRKEAEGQLKHSLREKELLLKEIHHRVKNNLLVVSSLLDWQTEYVDDPTIIKTFEESQHRIRSMALIHEKLYQAENIAQIDLSDYLQTLTNQLFYSFDVNTDHIQLNYNIEPIYLNIETATPCGLIVNELIANIFEHAFPDHQPGEVWLELHQQDQAESDRPLVTLTIRDNGVGLPEGLDIENIEFLDSLGLQLVCLLTEQLDGKLQLHKGEWTIFEITFSELQYSKRL